MVWRLSGFGDEIDPEPEVQLSSLAGDGIRLLDLRGAWGKNVLDLSDEELARLEGILAQHGAAVSVVASPIGKSPIGEAFAPHLPRFGRALDVARRLRAPAVRIFSFYVPAGEDPAPYREEVIDRLGRLVRATEGTGLTLLHENEKGIYGDTPERCRDLLATVGSPTLRAIWDPANFVQCGVRPHTEGFDRLRPYIAALHVKDARLETGEVVPAGEGDGEFRQTIAALRDDGFAGVCAFEPHLAVAGHTSGFTGPERFRTAVAAFTGLLREQGIAWE